MHLVLSDTTQFIKENAIINLFRLDTPKGLNATSQKTKMLLIESYLFTYFNYTLHSKYLRIWSLTD